MNIHSKSGKENISYLFFDSKNQTIKQITVNLYYTGNLHCIYTGNNSKITPTETIREFILKEAKQSYDSTEKLLLALSEKFLKKYPIEAVELTAKIKEPNLLTNGTFIENNLSTFCSIKRSKDNVELFSGFQDLTLIKTKDSSFTNLPKEINFSYEDRVLFSKLNIIWKWENLNPNFNQLNKQSYQAILTAFSEKESTSCQNSLQHIANAIGKINPHTNKIITSAENIILNDDIKQGINIFTKLNDSKSIHQAVFKRAKGGFHVWEL